jgi:ArsR family transcriptional regulator, virulence genes transcriptional regulator
MNTDGGMMEKTDIFELHADLCKTLSNPKRLMILALLAKKEMSVGEIAEVIAVPLSNVSQHLSLLKAQSLVQTRKDGQTVHYSLADRRIIQACTLIRSVLLDKMKERGQIAREIDPRYVVAAI